ncbi:MAG: hypothetical protein LBB41_01360 [Prevotellaceae bacterium]|jgi:hypothetical protein|nr:hypothetical protein [Prevotellaceae bacterium]
MKKIDKFWLGFVVGVLLPAAFIVVYLITFYTNFIGLRNTLMTIFPSALFGKLLLLSIFPNLLLCFVFYKTDTFRIAIGFMTGGIPYLIASFFML